MRRVGGVNAAGHQACSLPRSATLALSVVCSPATTMALAPQQRFFPFALYVHPHFQYTHAHCVPYHNNDRHDQSLYSLLCSLLQTMIDTRSNVTLFNSSNQQRNNDRHPRSAVFCNNDHHDRMSCYPAVQQSTVLVATTTVASTTTR
jgi:hypothetical protein